jgi:thiamine-phosphate pyrophosphorylase
LYAITPDWPDTGRLLEAVGFALAGGARCVQYRAKSLDWTLRREQAGRLLALCRDFGVPLIVNDSAALAAEIGADGVHLGRGDGSVAHARDLLGKGGLIGVSCYDRLDLALQARQAGADYVAFGSFFPSPTKPAAVSAPLTLLAEAKRQVQIPVVAIGGITPENGGTLVEAGADGLAVISALFGSRDIRAAAEKFRRLFRCE